MHASLQSHSSTYGSQAAPRRRDDSVRTRRSYLYAGGRLVLAALLITQALVRLVEFGQARVAMNVLGLGTLLAVLSVAVELTAGVVLALGWKVRRVSKLLVGWLVVLSVLAYSDLWNPVSRAMVIANIAMIGGLMMLMARGPGSRSLDRILEEREERRID